MGDSLFLSSGVRAGCYENVVSGNEREAIVNISA